MKKRYLIASLLIVSSFVNAMETKGIVNPNNWDEKKYKENSSRQCAAAMAVLSHIPFNKNDDVLDIGCGDGKITREIAKKVPYGMVKGLDISPNMIKCASEDHADISNLFFEHANITNYTSKQKFNYIFSFASFAWIKEQQNALINIANALKPTGKFVGGIAHEDSHYLRVRYKIMTDEKWKNYFVDYEVPYYPLNEDKIKQLCENAGLTVVSLEKRGSPFAFTREDFIKFMRALPVQLDKVPHECQEEFLNDIVDDYIKEVPQKEDGKIELLISGMLLIAQK